MGLSLVYWDARLSLESCDEQSPASGNLLDSELSHNIISFHGIVVMIFPAPMTCSYMPTNGGV